MGIRGFVWALWALVGFPGPSLAGPLWAFQDTYSRTPSYIHRYITDSIYILFLFHHQWRSFPTPMPFMSVCCRYLSMVAISGGASPRPGMSNPRRASSVEKNNCAHIALSIDNWMRFANWRGHWRLRGRRLGTWIGYAFWGFWGVPRRYLEDCIVFFVHV